jgi:hypothetical protein
VPLAETALSRRGDTGMRILWIELPAQLGSSNEDVSLSSPEIRQMLFQELEGIRHDLEHLIEARISSYFPQDYEVSVRLHSDRNSPSMQIIVWVSDPNIRWPAGLLARRAWNLSVPILAHVVEEAFSEQVQNVDLKIDKAKARVKAFASTRFWKDPLVLAVAVFVLTTLYWNFVHQPIVTQIRGLFGY